MAEKEITIVVRDTVQNTDQFRNLKQEWCKCGKEEFLCYPEDGTCSCGYYKHHVHCVCGGITQVG